MQVQVDEADLAQRAADDGRIPISLSSEAPVDRWFGREILDHAPASVDLTYARAGLPFLMDHDTGRQIGLIEEVSVAKDGRLRGMLRQGNHPDAAWVFADIRAGIRPNISVGYRVQAMQLEATDETGDTYRVTSWLPMEGSTVPVPADITVGAGRAAEAQFPVTVIPVSREAKETQMEQMTAPAAGAAPVVGVARDFDAERKQRNTEMVALADLAGARDTLADALARDLTPAQYARELQERRLQQAAATPSAAASLTPKEDKQYSLSRFFRAQLALRAGDPHAFDREKAGFEREISDHIAQKVGRDGFHVPLSLRAAVTGNIAGTTSLGGAGVQQTVLDLIEILRNQLVVRQLGARVLTGLTSNITFPRQITANTVNWTGENPASGNTLGAATFDNVTLSPKTAMISSALSRQLILQSSFDAEQMVREDFVRQIAVEVDRAALAGSGASNQPTGLLTSTATTTVTTTFGSNGAVPDWAALVQFETSLATGNAPTNVPWKWLTTPSMRGKLKTVLQSTVAGASWLWGADNTINGYEAAVSNNVPSNYTLGTATTICHGMILGNWSELLIGEFGQGAVQTLVDPYTVADQNMIKYHSMVMVDVAVRHGASFAVTKGARLA